MRNERLMMLTAWAAIATAGTLVVIKALAWYASGSVAMLGSLTDSAMDVAASIINFLAIRYALMPADAEHRFGHGKAEALAGLGQGALITISALFLLSESVQRVRNPLAIEASALALGVTLVSLLLTILLVLLQRHTVRRTGSAAIAADQLHYLSDVLVNIGVLLALLGALLLGWLWLDGAVGLLVGLYILRSALQIGWQSAQLLLDRELADDIRLRIAAQLMKHPQARGWHDLRTRASGQTWFVQCHVEMRNDLSLEEAHQVIVEMMQLVQQVYPQAQVMLHPDPVPAAE